MSAENVESPSSNPGGRYVGPNPLPEGAAGPDLLVDLMTERVIQKLKLRENWEELGGWDYDDLRAIAACALGASYATDADRARMAVVEKRTLKALMKEIRKHAAPPLFQGEGPGETVTPEAYYVALILGLFDETNPIDSRKNTEGGAMAAEFADVMGVPPNKIKGRPFEHPKRVVMDRYREHLDRREQRVAFRTSQGTDVDREVRGEDLSNEDVFRLVLNQVSRMSIPGVLLAPEREKEVEAYLMGLGIRLPRR